MHVTKALEQSTNKTREGWKLWWVYGGENEDNWPALDVPLNVFLLFTSTAAMLSGENKSILHIMTIRPISDWNKGKMEKTSPGDLLKKQNITAVSCTELSQCHYRSKNTLYNVQRKIITEKQCGLSGFIVYNNTGCTILVY